MAGKPQPRELRVGICILAGGMSSRMGRRKETLKLSGRTLLQHVRAQAKSTGWPVRVLRRDSVERCGPLGGIYTGLSTSRMEAELFLACDMPFVSREWMLELRRALGAQQKAIFTMDHGEAGFPFLLRVTALPLVEQQLGGRRFSLQSLARKAGAKLLRIPAKRRTEVFNINTPEDWRKAWAIAGSVQPGEAQDGLRTRRENIS